MSAKISALPNMAALTGTEQITGVQGGANKNVTPAQIATFIGTGTVQVFEGNYAGAIPPFTPTTAAIAFDTSSDTQWNFYGGTWH
jgi:hypothetical protein